MSISICYGAFSDKIGTCLGTEYDIKIIERTDKDDQAHGILSDLLITPPRLVIWHPGDVPLSDKIWKEWQMRFEEMPSLGILIVSNDNNQGAWGFYEKEKRPCSHTPSMVILRMKFEKMICSEKKLIPFVRGWIDASKESYTFKEYCEEQGLI